MEAVFYAILSVLVLLGVLGLVGVVWALAALFGAMADMARARALKTKVDAVAQARNSSYGQVLSDVILKETGLT
jgi:hypothetical protein